MWECVSDSGLSLIFEILTGFDKSSKIEGLNKTDQKQIKGLLYWMIFWLMRNSQKCGKLFNLLRSRKISVVRITSLQISLSQVEAMKVSKESWKPEFRHLRIIFHMDPNQRVNVNKCTWIRIEIEKNEETATSVRITCYTRTQTANSRSR